MGGGGGNTTTQTSEPWSGQQPFLQDIFRQAQRQFRAGPQEFFPGSTVAGFSPQTLSALNAMQQRAGGAPYEQTLQNFLTGVVTQPGIDVAPAVAGANTLIGGLDASQGVLNQFARNPFEASVLGMPGAGGFADVLGAGFGGLDASRAFAGNPTGSMDASVNYVNNLLGSQGSMVPSAATDQLTATASGEFLGSNPFLNDVFNTAAERVTDTFNRSVLPGINATFGAAGRTGSGIHQELVSQAADDLGSNLSGLAANIFAPAFESERNRQMQAAGQLGNLGLSESQQRLQAAGLGGDLFSAQNAADLSRLGLASDLYLGERGLAQQGAGMGLGFLEGGLDRSLNAANALGSFGLGGLGLLGDLSGQQAGQQLTAAGMIPALADLDFRNLAAGLGVGSAFDELAQRQLDDQVARFNFEQQAPAQALQQYANLIYGAPSFGTTTTTEQVRSNPLAGALGGAMSGFSMFGPWGALGGGILGALGS